jgi:dimethylhistidine N-methyltransferase
MANDIERSEELFRDRPHGRPPRQGSAAIGSAVREGLGRAQKALPPWLFYDAMGSALYERITELSEYYPTRAEAELLSAHGAELLALAAGDDRLAIVEIGAGSATKTELLLRTAARRQGACRYLACDIAPSGPLAAKQRMAVSLPSIEVEPVIGTHERAVPHIARLRERQLLLFLGSSIGNLADAEAVALLSAMRAGLRDDAALLLGADSRPCDRKSVARLVAAYDDAQGVTAAFNLNVLARINRELDADFELSGFAHRALWNEAQSRIEMHLVARRSQVVHLRALELSVRFANGEHIHTESSAKYDAERIDAILSAAGFTCLRSLAHPRDGYALHLSRCRRVLPSPSAT